MKVSQRGFILKRTAFSESSTIIKCFTKDFGVKNFLFKGAKKKSSQIIQSLAPIEFTFDDRFVEKLNTIYHVELFYHAINTQSNPFKTSLIFYQNEILNNVLVDGLIDKELFKFVENEYKWLNENYLTSSYLIYWLLELIKILGFDANESDKNDFKLSYSKHVFFEILNMPKNDLIELKLEHSLKKEILSIILNYYKNKIPNFKEIKSIEVYESIWQ